MRRRRMVPASYRFNGRTDESEVWIRRVSLVAGLSVTGEAVGLELCKPSTKWWGQVVL